MQPDLDLESEREGKDLQSRFQGWMVVAFLLFFILAILLEYYVRDEIQDERWKGVVSMVAGSLAMAVILGFTFEVLLSNLRDRTFESLFSRHFSRHFASHRKEVFQYLDSVKLFSVESLFDLLESIARQTPQLPTLYPVPRTGRLKEFTFADGMEFLENLVRSRPRETVEVLRRWIRPSSHPHVKFLASDFIGHFEFKQLKSELLAASRHQIQKIEEGSRDHVTSGEAWALNYVWAASRCPENPELIYKELGDLLCSTPSVGIQRWILFVPRQMPHLRFLDLINAFLGVDQDVADDVIYDVIETLASLQREQVGSEALTVRAVMEDNHKRFQKPGFEKRIDERWASLPVESRPQLAEGRPVETATPVADPKSGT